MKTARELEELFDIDAEIIDRIDEAATRGMLEGSAGVTVTGPGRPPLFDGAMQQVTFKERHDRVKAIDLRAEQLGIRRFDYLRQLVENDLQCSGLLG